MVNRKEIIKILKEISHPQIPVNIWDLGLIYEAEILDSGKVIKIVMTLTGDQKPEERALPEKVKSTLASRLPNVSIQFELIFTPMWNPDFMNEDAKKKLGIEA